jgi:mono/diheme cytochrome c family protein
MFVLVACNAGNGEGLNKQGRPNAETPMVELPNNFNEPPETDPNKIRANLTSIQEHIFTPICSSCHGRANPAAGQDLSTLKTQLNNRFFYAYQ